MKTQKKPRERRQYSLPKLDMAPMIDVVFLLLIFFIVVTKPKDIMARFEVSKPGPQIGVPPPTIPTTTLDIVANRYYVYGNRYRLDQLRKPLARLKDLCSDKAIVITSDSQSSHSSLVKLLDLCAELGIKNLAVMSR